MSQERTEGEASGAGISRRSFLRSSAVAAAAPLVVAGAKAQPAAVDPDVLKVGLVGCGGRGTGAALQAMSAEDGTVALTAVGDVFQDRLEGCLNNLKEALGEERQSRLSVDPEQRFVGFDAFQKVIDSDVDVVLLATPPHFRPQHLRAAIEAGKHVFCEKPVAVDSGGVRSVLETAAMAKNKELSIVSGFCWRYNIRHRALYERVHEGQIGAIRAIYSNYNTSPIYTKKRQEGWTDMEWQLRNWHHFLWIGGDHIVEQAVHSLDKMAWTMGDQPPLQVTSVGGRQARKGPETGNIYDHFSAVYDYPDGVKGFHMCRQIGNCSNDNSDYVWGEKGNAKINGWAPLHEIDGADPWIYEGESNDMYQQEHDELFAAIRSGKEINNGVWMAHSTLLAIMARMAGYTGKTITWEQALNSQEKLGPETYEMGPVGMEPVPVPGVTQFV